MQPQIISTDIVTQYAQDVVNGQAPAGPHVRAACARHLRDLEEQEKRGFYWDLEKALHVINFFPLVLRLNGGKFEGLPFNLEPWQAFIVGSIFGWKWKETGYRRFNTVYIETAKGSGKSPLAAGIGLYCLIADKEPRSEVYAAAPLALDTPVPTPTGWTTQGELKVGDQVFDENGKVCNVTYLSPILENKECFEVEFDDGTVIVSDANHRWLTADNRGQRQGLYKPAVVSTKQIAETLRCARGRLRHWIPVGGTLNLSDIELPVDPYVLGAWLGDGKSNRGSMCYHKDDKIILKSFSDAGYAITDMKSYGDTCYSTITGLKGQLRDLGVLENKHVPELYMRTGKSQRLALLAGLMDTDGTCTKTGECRFTNRNKKLAVAVYELATSLGARANLREITVTGKPHWVVAFKADKTLPVFRLQRKFERQIENVNARAKGRYVRDVRPCPSVPVRCIEVSSESHLYLVSKANIATHNTKRDQAMILFRDAVAMVDQSPDLTQNLHMSGGKGKEWKIDYHKANSFFVPISSDDGQSGPRPHVGLIDELHEHKNGTVVEMIRAGFKFRTQPILLMITNSGTDKKSVCWEYRQFGAEVSAGSREDDTMFSYICALDEKDDPFKDESCWPKANPSLGKTIEPKYLRDQVTQAKGMPAKESLVKRLNFCIWTEAANPWITYEVWLNAADKLVDEDIYKNRKCYGGLDLSSNKDLTAFVLAFEPTDEDPVWRLREWFWLPGDGIKKKSDLDRVDYVNWAQHGYLELTPGAAISKRFVLQRIMQITQGYNLSSICYDRWRIEDLKQVAADEAIALPNMIPFGQGYKDMAPALDLFEEKLINNGIMHDGNPVMTWCAANAVIESDASENRKVAKDKAKGRVDGVVAAIMAMGAPAKEDIKPPKQYQVYSVKR